MSQNIKIQTTSTIWGAVLAYCKLLDVENDDSPSHMYSVRSKTKTLTIWSQPGFKNNWYQAKISPSNISDESITLIVELGTAPVRYSWPLEKIQEHLENIIRGVTKS